MGLKFKIEKGIPIPKSRGTITSVLLDMEIGDSFFYVEEKVMNSVYAVSKRVGKKNGMDFTTRKVDGGYRTWRIGKETNTNRDVRIEKTIPIPDTRYVECHGTNILLQQLEVGESFLNEDYTRTSAIISTCTRLSNKYGRKFRTRKVDGGWRTWRVE